MKLSLVIPVYNEIASLRAAVQRVVAVDLDKELVLIDDGSTDGSRGLLSELAAKGLDAWLEKPQLQRGRNEVRVHLQPKNMGKGAALRTGFGLTTGDIVVIQDADLEYRHPTSWLNRPIRDGIADAYLRLALHRLAPARAVLLAHGAQSRLIARVRVMPERDLNITDMETCYKAFRADVIKAVVIEEDRFGIEPELTAKLAKMSLRMYEVPISYQGRTYAEGKKIGWKDGVRDSLHLLAYGAAPAQQRGVVRGQPNSRTSPGRPRLTVALLEAVGGRARRRARGRQRHRQHQLLMPCSRRLVLTDTSSRTCPSAPEGHRQDPRAEVAKFDPTSAAPPAVLRAATTPSSPSTSSSTSETTTGSSPASRTCCAPVAASSSTSPRARSPSGPQG